MDGVREEAQKLLADFRAAIGRLTDAKGRLQESAFVISDADKAISKMAPGTGKAFAQARLETLRGKLTSHAQRVAVLNKAASALWSTLKKVLHPFGLELEPLQGSPGVGIAIVLPIVAVAALLIAASKLYSAVVTDTKQANFEAAKLQLLAEGKITPGELAEAFKKPPARGIFDDVGKMIAAAAVVVLLPTIISATRGRA